MNYKKYCRQALVVLLIGMLTLGMSMAAFAASVKPQQVPSGSDPILPGCTSYKIDQSALQPGRQTYNLTVSPFAEIEQTTDADRNSSPVLPAGANVTITLYNGDEGQYIDWASNHYFRAVLIKGGSGGGNLYFNDSPVNQANFFHNPINPSGKFADISHITFYYCGTQTQTRPVQPQLQRPQHAQQGGPARGLMIQMRGKPFQTDLPPVIVSGRTLIPLRAVANGLKATVDWNALSKIVTITRGGVTITFNLDHETFAVNGVQQRFDVKPQIMNNRTFVPLRFIAQSLGEKVHYDASTLNITIGD